MTPVELSRTVLHAVRRAVDAGQLCVSVPERVAVTVPGPGGCGDYATNVALQLARPAGRAPRDVADILRPHLAGTDGITDVVVTGPGFLNISLDDTAPVALVAEVLRRGSRYGFADAGADAAPDGGSESDAAPDPDGGSDPDADADADPESESDAVRRVVQLHAPREIRAVVVMDAVARLLRSQGTLVRTSCAAPPPEEWTAVLGVHVDAAERPGCPLPPDTTPRPTSRTPRPTSQRPLPATVIRPVPPPPTATPLRLGRDAARWALLHPAGHDRPRIGDEHLVQRESNPLFRVRYAHARARALVRNAADLGFGPEAGPVGRTAGAEELLALLADHPRVLAAAADQHAPDRLARHLVAVADAALPFLPTVLPRGAEKPSAAHRARLALAEAAGAVLAGGLSLLGIDAPDHL
ncbi:ArgS-related anticodon-binding protein NrtL [Streptomyces sp. HMX87]|uniref:ArgS-related anticodon-binding protein NrtL n=1 Tax=Streptomyces sp. HMX87 TaxID=3390849 RepID=UPI003A878847